MGEIYLDALRNGIVNTDTNPYYTLFQSKTGLGLSDEGLYSNQIDFQRGYGFYKAQLGYGLKDRLFNWFQKAKIFATPYLKQGLHQVVDVAKNVAGDVLEGKNVRQSLTSRIAEKKNELLSRAATKAPEIFQTIVRKAQGGGRKRRASSKKKKKKTQTKQKQVKYSQYPVLDLM